MTIILNHYFGQNVLEKLKDSQIDIEAKLFDVGTLGLDFLGETRFYHKRRWNRRQKFLFSLKSIKYHDFMESIINEAKKNALLKSYLYGLTANYCLFSNLNPYLIYQRGVYLNKVSRNNDFKYLDIKLDRAIDSFLIKTYYNTDPNVLLFDSRIIKMDKFNKALKYSLDKSFISAYNYRSGYRMLNKAFIELKENLLYLYDPKGKKTKFFSHFNKQTNGTNLGVFTYYNKLLKNVDIFNERGQTWKHLLSQNEYTYSFWELFNASLEEAVKLIKELDSHFSGKIELDLEKIFNDHDFILASELVSKTDITLHSIFNDPKWEKKNGNKKNS